MCLRNNNKEDIGEEQVREFVALHSLDEWIVEAGNLVSMLACTMHFCLVSLQGCPGRSIFWSFCHGARIEVLMMLSPSKRHCLSNDAPRTINVPLM